MIFLFRLSGWLTLIGLVLADLLAIALADWVSLGVLVVLNAVLGGIAIGAIRRQ